MRRSFGRTVRTKFLSDTEINGNRFSVTNVEVPIRLRRKARLDPTAALVGGNILGDDLLNEVRPRFMRIFHGRGLSSKASVKLNSAT